ncbi:TIGR02530 family flagellar biosynthesis protein [Alkaliphilus peptidifermentans]|uniref:Flagellar operon protein n=1 Tax=Alkaliphilus peptidifermentans DSM 18978 TaxID=1120976 RepID=A0A1G5DH99_9FIRM|nr:TIGR02530 family flagellar biosynthesis protein [Alkaliphilus peptidifermentans]SCY14113.1 flagellar operon protein [Alkaliphilus peptidifermentans DSM 18978]
MYDNMKIKQSSLQQPRVQQLNNQIQKNHSFDTILQKQIHQSKELKFSKHAMDRLEKRNIQLSGNDMTRLNQALDIASEKGIKETLIMMDNRVFVASVTNKTVITAAVDEQLKESVFTNIDGAVIV